MTVNNNLNLAGMLAVQMEVNQMAQNIAQVANNVGDPEFQGASTDIINSLVQQTPQVISYSANAQGISTQQAALDTLLNIKA
ncbi:hypothetical protein [Halarcobacter anaerophilus]|uniref:Uncharacterized protein n=1 Tax=Halarcobacter anaerophilus TaxID=877500 RepID=A0A4V1LQ74_9BACT|nr:hypothetical protein [Halarcobacter anaerophilus]QDF29079.1 hypothetical protein AANAER_1602 [Halarcobacter anaerophilus]RXJ63708.1 hypothetical protein CRV06_05835 [Halarcobacter anaerophilus]